MRLRTKVLIAFGILFLLLFSGAGGFAYLLFHRTPGEYADFSGVRIHYTVEGAGEPLILVHGVGATADLNWRRPGIIRALAKNFQVIAFDLRGHGLSDKPQDPDQYGLRMVEDIVSLMDHLHIERAHVAGYSLGGFLALKAATLHPDRISRLAVCAAGWIDPENPVPVPNPYRPPERAEPVRQASMSLPVFAASKSLFHRLRNRIGDYILDENVKKAIKARYEDLTVKKTDLLECDLPMLCIIGQQDGFLYLARDLAAAKPDIQLYEITGAGHFSLPFNGDFQRHLAAFFCGDREQ